MLHARRGQPVEHPGHQRSGSREKWSGGQGPGRTAAAHQLIFLAHMPLGQATEILELHNQLTPEVTHLMQFLEAQHLGRMGRARERNTRQS